MGGLFNSMYDLWSDLFGEGRGVCKTHMGADQVAKSPVSTNFNPSKFY